MTDRQYARKRPEPQLAWHVINFHTRGLNTWKALCGRTVIDPTVDVLPAGPSCESCLRSQRRQDDPALGGMVPGSEPQLIVSHVGEIIIPKPIDDDGSTWPESVP